MNISPQEFKDKILFHKHLPEGLMVEGSLYLHGCTSLTHLPERLVVENSLYLYDCTSLTHLPEGLVVMGTIYCDQSLIDKIPKEDLPLYINYNFEEDIHEHITSRIQR